MYNVMIIDTVKPMILLVNKFRDIYTKLEILQLFNNK